MLKMLFEKKKAGRSRGSKDLLSGFLWIGSVRDAAEVKRSSEMQPDSPNWQDLRAFTCR